jgi:UDP-glucose:(heptosyl)LPS alpha-1,3-glucosyltransferase
MRLGLVYHQFVAAGGLEGYLMEFARRLELAGHELKLVTSRVAPELGAVLKAEVVPVPWIAGSPLLRLWYFARRAAGLVDDLGVDAVLGFGRSYRHQVHRAGGGCHLQYSALLPFWKRYSLKNLLELQLERRLYTGGETARFVTNSRQVTAELVAAYGVDKERFETIHTAVDGERFRPAEDGGRVRAAVRSQMKTAEDARVFLFVSLSHRRKGLENLLRALARVPDAVLWVVGKPLSREMLALIQQLGLGARIRVLMATKQMTSLYQAADWFVHPTLYDACANTVLQSMACGLPGLISSRDGAMDLVADGRTGFVLRDVLAVEEMAEVMRRALALDEGERRMMGQVAREAVSGLSWDNHLRQWEDLLQAGWG